MVSLRVLALHLLCHNTFLLRSLQSRASIQSSSMKSFHYRSYRLHGHSHPAVVSSTQSALCLTPSKSGFLPLDRRRRGTSIERQSTGSAHSSLPYSTSVATFITRDDVTGEITSPTPPTMRSLPVTKTRPHRQLLTHKRSAQSAGGPKLVTCYKPPTPPLSGRSPTSQTAPLLQDPNRRLQTLKTYRAQLQSYFSPRRGDVSLIGRKMAPVLRVLPASSRSTITKPENVKKLDNDVEVTSQKRVRFSDQLGFPLVRNMTPNYRRKHSYILRWLETAGRTTQAMT